jgi:hypothetical protein
MCGSSIRHVGPPSQVTALGRSPASSSGAWLPVINPGHRERFEHRLAQHVGQSLGVALPSCRHASPGEPLEIFMSWHDEQPPPADCPNALRARASPMTEPLRTAAVHAPAIPAADHVPRSARVGRRPIKPQQLTARTGARTSAGRSGAPRRDVPQRRSCGLWRKQPRGHRGGSMARRSKMVMSAVLGDGNPTETRRSSNSGLCQRVRRCSSDCQTPMMYNASWLVAQ